MPIHSAFLPATAGEARIDIRFGGSPDDIYRESLALAKAYLTSLPAGMGVFYLNTLVPEGEMDDDARHIAKTLRSTSRAERIRIHTIEVDELVQKQKMFIEAMKHLRVRVLVVNSFDFAASSPKARRRLFLLLKHLRDFHRLHIILYVRREVKPEMPGWPGEIAWIASSVSELDKPAITFRRRRANAELPNESEQQTANQEVEEGTIAVSESGNLNRADGVLEVFAATPTGHDTTFGGLELTDWDPFLIDNLPLEIKDLAMVSGYPTAATALAIPTNFPPELAVTGTAINS